MKLAVYAVQLVTNMNHSIKDFFLKFLLIYLFIYSTHGTAIQGDNVRRAVDNEFPFTVAISDVSNDIDPEPSNFRQFCTGSLITKKHVLTAEHCVQTKQIEHVEILVGSTNLDYCKSYDPQMWTTYQEWKYNDAKKFPPYYNDVAIITLKSCVAEANVQVAVVPKFNPQDICGTKVKIAGWGLTNRNIKPTNLRTVDLTILKSTDCQSEVSQIMKKNFTIFEWQLCATSDPWALNGCGDSGGPLINQRNEVIGITMGTCPDDAIISQKYPRQVIYMNKLMEKRVNMHASLHYYQDFIAYFIKIFNTQGC